MTKCGQPAPSTLTGAGPRRVRVLRTLMGALRIYAGANLLLCTFSGARSAAQTPTD